MDFLNYREQLGISFNDRQRFDYFSARMHNKLSCQQHYFIREEYIEFCNLSGIRIEETLSEGNYYEEIEEVLDDSVSLSEYLLHYMTFINCKKVRVYDDINLYSEKDEYLSLIKSELESSGLQYDVIEADEDYYIFPKGVDEFDKELIGKPLTWLSKYPDAEQAWINAIRAYSNPGSFNASDIADLFRKALETFFKTFFNNDKSLENNISIYGRYLKEHGIPAELSNNFETLLKMYINYNNNYAKHNDGAEVNVLEYIMYQTGNIIRLLCTLKNE